MSFDKCVRISCCYWYCRLVRVQVYWVGPFTGAIIAALLYELLFAEGASVRNVINFFTSPTYGEYDEEEAAPDISFITEQQKKCESEISVWNPCRKGPFLPFDTSSTPPSLSLSLTDGLIHPCKIGFYAWSGLSCIEFAAICKLFSALLRLALGVRLFLLWKVRLWAFLSSHLIISAGAIGMTLHVYLLTYLITESYEVSALEYA